MLSYRKNGVSQNNIIIYTKNNITALKLHRRFGEVTAPLLDPLISHNR